MPKKKETKSKVMSIQALVNNVNKKYGKGTLLPASEATSLVMERLPSGIFDLDMKLGGGWPRGRINMIKGDWSTGKSAVCFLTAAEAQRHCRFCGTRFENIGFLGEVSEFSCKCGKNEPMRVVWMDAEHSLDPSWASKFGVVTEDVLVIETEYAEQAIDIADAAIRSRECDLLIVDSVAALTPGVEVEETAEKWQMGVMARLMNKALRKWTSGLNSFGLLAETKCTILLVNQMRVGIGGFRPTTTSPGGRGLDFFESVDVRFKKVDFIEDKSTERPIGVNIEFVIKKNKTAPPAPPGGGYSLYFIPSPGEYAIGSTDVDAQTLRLAVFWGIVQKRKAWLYFPDGTKYQGKKAARLALRTTPDLLQELQELVIAKELAWIDDGKGRSDVVDEEED